MDTKAITNYILSIIFSLLYLCIFSHYINKISGTGNVSIGLFVVIIGIWGFVANQILVKIFIFEKHPRIINSILIIIGILLLFYKIPI